MHTSRRQVWSRIVATLCITLAVGGCARGTMLEPRGNAGPFVGGDAGPAVGDAGALRTTDAAVPPIPPDAASAAPDAAPVLDCSPSTPVCDRGVYDRAQAYASANPLRDGGSWSGWCASLMYRFGGFSRSAPSAIDGYHASAIVSTDASTAPVGAFHWWDIGADGHVGVDLLGGGTTVFMASGHLAESWGTSIGVNGVGPYGAASGARYLGWSMDFVGQNLPGGGASACIGATLPAGCPVPRTATQTSGAPDAFFWMRMQMFAAEHGYTGPIDGVMGVASWAGIQRAMGAYGYTGPDDGVPGTHTYMALQQLAASHGYTGPIDGALGPNSYRGIATFLNETF